MKTNIEIKNKYIICLVIFMFGITGWSQNILISQGGTINVNGGETFYDAGGASGNDGNTNHSITLCPSSPGYQVALNFTFFNTYYYADAFTDERDILNIHNGNSIIEANIGSLAGDYSQRFSNGTNPFRVGSRAPFFSGTRVFPLTQIQDIYSPTIFTSTSADGCITLNFINGSNQLSPGWEASVSLFKLADLPGCNISIDASETSICNGQSTTLTVAGSITSTPINNSFNDSTIGSGWNATAAASFLSNVCGSGSLDNSIFLWMQNLYTV